MSELVEKVVGEVKGGFYGTHLTQAEARAAIKAVAEWLEAQSKDDRSSANMVANVLFDQLEAK